MLFTAETAGGNDRRCLHGRVGASGQKRQQPRPRNCSHVAPFAAGRGQFPHPPSTQRSAQIEDRPTFGRLRRWCCRPQDAALLSLW